MFTFRYHVVSLAAVFVALVVGILVGIGISGRGFVDKSERRQLQNQIDDLRNQRDDLSAQLAASQKRQKRSPVKRRKRAGSRRISARASAISERV